MKKNTKLRRQYIREIKRMLPTCHRAERKFLIDMTESVDGFTADNENASMEDIIDKFGEPKNLVGNYVMNMEAEELRNNMRTAHFVKTGVCAVIACILLCSFIFINMLYNEWQTALNTNVNEIQCLIEIGAEIIP